MPRSLPFVIFLVFVASIASADDLEAEFHALIEANTHPVTWDGESLGGEGADWIANEIAEAHYFMIGERHATADIAVLSARLFEVAASEGYTHAVLEVGPIIGDELQRLLAESGSEALTNGDADEAFLEAVAFFLFQEERDFVADLHRAGMTVAGADQEFIFSGDFHRTRLKAAAQTPAQREALAALDAIVDEQQYYVGSAEPAIFEALEAAFATHDDELMRETARALRVTNAIYRPFLVGGPVSWSNVERENYVKTNWYQLIRSVAGPGELGPRMAFKWGANHAAPDVDGNGRITFGTFVEDWATVHGVTSFNLGIDCNAGQSLSTGGTKQVPQDCVSWFLSGRRGQNTTNEAEEHLFSRHLSGKSEPVLIDFRPVREYLSRWNFLTPEEKRMIAGYDAYLALAGTKAATVAGD